MNAKDVMLARALSSGGGSGYTLPVASPTRLGGVKPEAATDEMSQPVGVDAAGKLFTAPSGGAKEIWCDDLLASGILEAEISVDYDTGITLAKLREYATFSYRLKGASNTRLRNLYLCLGKTEAAIDRGDEAGRICIYGWANDEKTIIRPISGYNGNPSMVGNFSANLDHSPIFYGLGQYNILRYIDLSTVGKSEKVKLICLNMPTIDYAFEIRGLTK